MSFFDGVNARTLEEAPDGFKSFAIGENEAYIDDAVEGHAKGSGRPMLTVTFRTDDGADIKYHIVENEWKLQKLKQLYSAFGIPFSSTDVADWFHRRGIVVCKEDVYEGKTYPKVSYLKPLPGGGRQGRPGCSAGPDDEFKDDIPF